MATAIVTGGAVRLGRALADHLARKNYNIALHHNTSSQGAREAIEEIRARGVQCESFPCDFTHLDAVESLVRQVCERFSDVELLVNSAANFIQENLQQTSLSTLTQTLRINLMAPFLLMREYRIRVGRGMIVNLLDERVLRRVPTFAAYSVSKAGLLHLTELAAVEWGDTVRVNAIAPGLILPPAAGPADYLQTHARRVPMRTHGQVDHILRGLDYLLETPFVNGETLYIDGGESKGPAYRRSGPEAG